MSDNSKYPYISIFLCLSLNHEGFPLPTEFLFYFVRAVPRAHSPARPGLRLQRGSRHQQRPRAVPDPHGEASSFRADRYTSASPATTPPPRQSVLGPGSRTRHSLSQRDVLILYKSLLLGGYQSLVFRAQMSSFLGP